MTTKIHKIVFFNLWHRGDLHSSRSFVKFVLNFARDNNIICEYVSVFPEILKDLDIIKKDSSSYGLKADTKTFEKDGVLYFNTWFASEDDIFRQNGVSFDTLYFIFNKVLKMYFDIELGTDYWSLFPEIDHSKIQTSGVDCFVSSHKEKKILISNCNALSNQSNNFDINPVIEYLANTYKDTIFLITNDNGGIPKLNNVILSSSIIGNVGICDLNENSYLSTFCDVILGRYSGAYTTSITRKNYQRHVKMLPFCNGNDYTLGHTFINKLPLYPEAKIDVCRAQNSRDCISFFERISL
jgi:hypothetical protein